MGEGIEEDNSDIPDTTDDGQNNEEGGEKQDVEEEEITDVISNPDEPEKEPEVIVTDEGTDETTDPAVEAVTSTNSFPDAAVISKEAKVTAEFKNADESDTTTPADNAEVFYVGGCVSGENVVENRDLVFRVVPKAGRVLTKVTYKIGDAAAETDRTTAAQNGGDVTIGKGDIFTTADKVTTGKPVTITVTTKPVVYTVTLDNSADSTNSANYKLYAVTGEGDGVLAKDAYSAGVKVNYGESLRFALVPNADQALKPSAITLADQDISFAKKELTQTDGGDTKHSAYVFTVNPSEAKYELEKNADDDAEVTVAARALNKLTVTMTAATSNEYAYAVSVANTAEADFIAYNNGFTAIPEESADLAKSLAFMVKPTAGNLVTGVTAKVDAEDVTVAVADVTGSNNKECTIALDQLDLTESNVALTVSVETALDGAADGYAAISFKGAAAGDLDHVEYKAADSEASLESAESGKNNIPVKVTDGAKYYVQVAPSEDGGYNLTKSTADTVGADGSKIGEGKYIVNVKETRLVGTAKTETPVEYAVEAYDATAQKAKTITLNLTGGADAAAYTVKAVEITVGTEIVPNNDEKKVTFSGDLLDSVTIKNTTGVVLIDGNDNPDEGNLFKEYAIAEGTDLLEFEVASETEPTVERGGADLTGTAAEGKYSYSIPTSTLDPDSNEITVNAEPAKTKTLTVTATDGNLDSASTYTIDNGKPAPLTVSGGTCEIEAPVDAEVSLNLVAADDVIFGDVTYTVEGGEAQAATVSADKKTATLAFTVTENVAVDVETLDESRVRLTGTGIKPVEDKKNAFEADYDVSTVTVQLVSGAKATLQDIYDVVVLDGTTTAATTAKIETGKKSATIASIAEEDRGRTLTVRVYSDNKTYEEATLAVSGTSTGVTVKIDGKDIPEAGITMPTDSQVVLTVNAEGTEANLNDLKAALTMETAAGAASTEKANAFFTEADTDGTVNIDGGEITLTAKPVKDAPKDKVFLVLSSKTVKDETDSAKDKVFKKIPINVTGLLVKSADIKEVKAEAAASSNKSVRINLGLDFADEKNMPQAPMTGDLYYKVEITKVEGDAEIQKAVAAKTLELETTAELVQFVKIAKTNGSYNKANLAKFVEFNLVKSYAGSDTTGTDLPGIITTEAKVTLVQSLAGGSLTAASVADTDYVANADKAKDLKEGLKTSAPIYETKLSVKLVDGAKIFTGQQKVKVATPTFSKDTTCDEITVQFVNTKTGRIWGNSTEGNKTADATISGFKAGVNTDNSVWVSSTSGSSNAKDYKDLGVKVTAHAENDEYRASAVVKLKVQQGIYSISTDESKAALPTTLYSDAKNKVKSVKINTVLNTKVTKPAKSTLTWEITDSDGDSISAGDECDLDANIKKALLHTDSKGKAKPAITVKNGTVSVTADYQYNAKSEEANTFYVNAKAADFAGNETELNSGSPVCFVISKEPQVIEKLAVVNDGEEPVGEVSSDRNGAVVTLKAEEVIDGNLRIVALKEGAEVGEDGAYAEGNYLPATITISGKAVTLDKEHDASQPGLVFSKPGDKLTVTAKAVDGTNAKPVKMTLNVKPIEQLGLFLNGTDGSEYQPDHTAEITYSGSSNERYDLSLAYVNSAGEWDVLPAYKSVKVEVKDGKLVSNKDWAKDSDDFAVGSAVVVAAGKDTATITLKDSGNKNAVKNTYTIRADVNTKNMKAPNIKMTYPKKLTAGYNEEIIWKVSDQDKTTKEYLYAGQYVKLAPDHTVAPLNDEDKKYRDGERDAYRMLDWDGEYYRIDENGEIETWFSSTESEDSHYLMPGSYKLVATIGNIENGKFVPTTKDKKLSFSVPKWKKANTSLNVTAGYKLDVKAAAATKLLVKSDNSYKVFNAKNVIKKDQKLGDHSNNFTKYFEVKRYVRTYDADKREYKYEWTTGSEDTSLGSYGTYATIGLKDNLTVDDIKDITGQNESTKKEMKDNCTGYITVDNGSFRKDIKITVSFNELKKYTASTDPFFENSNQIAQTVKIFNGKTQVPVLYAGINEEGTNDLSGITVAEDGSGNITLTTAQTGVTHGKYTVSLKVVPTSAAVMKANDKAETPVLDKAAMLKDYWIPAELKLEVKELAKADKTLKTNTTVKLASYEYDDEKNGGYEFGDAGKYGSYRADVPYTLTAGNMTVKGVEVKLEGNVIDADKKLNLVEAENGTAKVWNSSKEAYDSVASINLKVNKEALEAAKNDRQQYLYYGKSLTVPVEITYENLAKQTAKETVNYKISIPKRPAETYNTEAVENKVKKLLVDINGEDPAETLNYLNYKIGKAVASLVPADTDYKVSAITFDKVKDAEADTPDTPVTNEDIVKTGKAVAKVTIINNVTKATTQTIDNTYDLGIKPVDMTGETVTLAALKSEIKTSLSSVDYAADLDSAKLIQALSKNDSLVKSVLDEAANGRKNYTITATVKHNSATVDNAASADVTVVIRNLTRSEKVEDEWVRMVTVEDTINDEASNVLNAFDAAYSAVKTFFETSKNVTDIVDNCSGVEVDIWAAVEAKAKELVKNPGITVTVNDKVYEAPTADDTETNDKDESADGKISFTIGLSQNGRVRNYRVAEATIDKANVGKYAPIDTVKTAVTEAVITKKGGTTNDKLKEIAAGTGGNALNTSNGLKTAIETEIKKFVPVKGANADAVAAAVYPGYEYEIKDWIFSAATSAENADAAVNFSLVITSKGNSATTATIPVSCTDLIKADAKYKTFDELVEEIGKLTTIELVAPPTDSDWKTKLATALEGLDTSSLSPTITVDEGTFTAAVAGENPADAFAANVKISITPNGGEDTDKKEITLTKITLTVKE